MTDKTELARRAVACKHWRWMPGMLSVQGIRCTEPNMLPPDLDDAATLGCLLALVVEVFVGWIVVVTISDGHAWVAIRGRDGPTRWDFQGPALGGVLVAALEAAP